MGARLKRCVIRGVTYLSVNQRTIPKQLKGGTYKHRTSETTHPVSSTPSVKETYFPPPPIRQLGAVTYLVDGTIWPDH